MATCNTVLEIRKGVAKTPGDAYSAEVGLDTLNLLDPQGFILDEWTMKYAGMKNAVWAESPLTPGRELIAGEDGNVTETMQIILSAPDMQTMGVMLSHLMQLRQDARDFQIESSIEPVYLVNRQTGEPGNRYALIRNLEVALREEPVEDDGRYIRDLSITIEREPYWRGEVPPGGNPKLWTCKVNGVPLSTTNVSLYSGVNHIVYGTVYNQQSFNGIYTFNKVNYIDIPAAKIPGDAPALVTIGIGPTGQQYTNRYYISKSINRTTIIDRAGNALPLFNTFALSASALQSATAAFTTDATRGIVHTPVSALSRTVVVTPVNTNEVNIAIWTVGATFGHLNATVLKGRYAVYLRGHQTGGAEGDTDVHVLFRNSAGTFFDSGLVTLKTDAGGTLASILHYLGTVTLPPDTHSNVAIEGKGVQVEYDFNILLSTQRSAGASTHELVDLILMPFDEGSVVILPDLYQFAPVNTVFDNTGYMTHGHDEAIATERYTPAGDTEFMPQTELRGDITLTPGVNNRLYLISDYEGFGGARADFTSPVYINIVPRWIGLRSV